MTYRVLFIYTNVYLGFSGGNRKCFILFRMKDKKTYEVVVRAVVQTTMTPEELKAQTIMATMNLGDEKARWRDSDFWTVRNYIDITVEEK